MLKPSSPSSRSPERAKKEKKKPSLCLTGAPVQSQAAKAAKDAGIWAPLDSLGAFAAWRPLPRVFEDRDR